MRGTQTVALIAAFGTILTACERAPNPRFADRLGAIPRFSWLDENQVRPAPTIAVVTVGGWPAPEGACFDRKDAASCLRRNWLSVLGLFGEGELRAPAGGRSYRFLLFPSFTPWVSQRLDVNPDGEGLLTTVVAGNPDTQDVAATWRRVRRLSERQVADIEGRIAEGSFIRIPPDARAYLPAKARCYDGADLVVEAYIGGRYRFVSRHDGEPDFEDVETLGATFLALEPEAQARMQPH
jgi:hypothetical protein